MARLDVYLDTRYARVTYQEQTREALQAQDQVPAPMEPVVELEDETTMLEAPHECVLPVVKDGPVSATKNQTFYQMI